MKAFSIYDIELDPETETFYRRVLETLLTAGVPFLVGGAFGFRHYTGISRNTKDIDVFVLRDQCELALSALGKAGWKTELTDSVWLAKARSGRAFADIIFRSGNAIAEVDSLWFTYATDANILNMPVKVCPAEETIWSKAFTMERERFDGGDIAHLILKRGKELDWERLLRRFAPHAQILLSHLLLFDFIYPGEREIVPKWVTQALWDKYLRQREAPYVGPRVCRGTLLSRTQYAIDIDQWSYLDGRREICGRLSPKEKAQWEERMEKETSQSIGL